jgi:hypothetical protein
MSNVTCPFKYPQYTYCDCPFPGKDVGIESIDNIKSLKQAWVDHLIELSNHEIDKANNRSKDE